MTLEEWVESELDFWTAESKKSEHLDRPALQAYYEGRIAAINSARFFINKNMLEEII